jgi:outer membrane protein assembly factor BamB
MSAIRTCGTWVRAAFQLLSLLALIAAAPAVVSATLSVQPQAGEPASTVSVSGSGMAAFEEVVLRYDGAALATARANAAGAFTQDKVEIPASALPGRRPIAAVGRSSGTRATVPFLVRTNWPQFHRGSFRHGETPHENVLGPDNVAQLQLLWDIPTGLYVDGALQGSPVVANGLVYILTSDYEQGRLLALDAATGTRRWSQPIGYSHGCGATPAVAQGRVYAPASGRMAAFDPRTGAVRWRVGESFCAMPSTPTVVDGKLFTATHGGPNLDARDATSGKLLWRRRVCIRFGDGSCLYASPFGPLAAGDGIVYVTNYAGGMAAYDVDTGHQLWSRLVGSGNLISTAPVVEGDVVYISVNDGRVHALNRLTGAELWSAPVGRFNHSTPALASGVLYAGSDSNGITAIDAKTGTVRWQQSAVGSVRTSPAVANGVVYLGAGDGRLYALDTQTGAVLYSRSIAPPGRLLSPSPAVADGVVYVGTGDRLLAFGLKPGAVDAGR